VTRNLYDHALSSWNQHVKWHAYTKSFAHFVRRDYANSQVKALRRYGQAFGTDNVRIINYDLAREDIVGWFFATIGVEAPSAWRAPRLNRGLTAVELSVQRALNCLHRDAARSKEYAQRFVKRRPHAAAARIARPDLARLLQDRFDRDLQILSRETGRDLSWMAETPAWMRSGSAPADPAVAPALSPILGAPLIAAAVDKRPVAPQASPEGAFYTLDRELKLVTASPATLAIWGRDAGDVVGRPLLELFPFVEGGPVHLALGEVLRSFHPVSLCTQSVLLGRPVEVDIQPIGDVLKISFAPTETGAQLQ
jgi:hypothetical protein